MKKYKKASDIKVGVIGYGGAYNMGKAHLDLMRTAGMTPQAVCEVDPARLQVAEADFPGIEQYKSVDTMLKKSDIDLIVIITPHNTHAKLALKCLQAGRHVICEKPLSITTAEADSMIAAAKKSGVLLSTYHNRHWDGRIQLAVDLVKNKKRIGDIVRIECHMGSHGQPSDWWRTSRTISGGILYDWGVHLLEYSLQLIEAPILEVSGHSHTGFWSDKTKWKDDTNEDEAYALVRFGSGQWLTLYITHLDSNPKQGWVEITGTRGTLVMDQSACTLYEPGKTKHVTTTYKNPSDEYIHYYNNIRDHLVKGAQLIITPEWARRPIHIIDLARQSAQKKKTLPA